MDKREFMKTSVATLAAGGAGSAAVEVAATADFSVNKLAELATTNVVARRMLDGGALASLATATAGNRLWFVADPVGFAEAHQIKVSKGLLEVLQPAVAEVDGQFATQISKLSLYESRLKSANMTKAGDTGQVVLPIVMAVTAVVSSAAAVVAAAAAVVAAVSITYSAFKWNIEVDA